MRWMTAALVVAMLAGCGGEPESGGGPAKGGGGAKANPSTTGGAADPATNAPAAANDRHTLIYYFIPP